MLLSIGSLLKACLLLASFLLHFLKLAKKGFDPLMGARPMQRLIQDTIRRALADELLFGKLVDGGRLSVDVDDKGETVLDIQPTPPKANKPKPEPATAA